MDNITIKRVKVVDSTKLMELIHAEVRALLVQHKILADYIPSQADAHKYILFVREEVSTKRMTMLLNMIPIVYEKYNVKADVIENTSHNRLFYIQVNRAHSRSASM